jgi:hypothetical protein
MPTTAAAAKEVDTRSSTPFSERPRPARPALLYRPDTFLARRLSPSSVSKMLPTRLWSASACRELGVCTHGGEAPELLLASKDDVIAKADNIATTEALVKP